MASPVQPSGAPFLGSGLDASDLSGDAWRVLPATGPDGDPAAQERIAQGFLRRIEAARSLGDLMAEERHQAEYARFLNATNAAWELAEAMPVEDLLSGRVSAPGPERRAELTRLLEHLEGYRPTAPRDFLSQACALMMLGDHFGALARVDAGLSLDPRHLHLRCARGEVQRGLGSLHQARAEFAMAARQRPDSPLALAGLGRVQIALGQCRAAVVPLKRALSISAHDPHLWRLAAEAMIGTDRIEQSLAFLRRAQNLDSGNVAGAQRLGQVLAHLGRHDEAATVYEHHLGRQMASQGQWEHAALPGTRSAPRPTRAPREERGYEQPTRIRRRKRTRGRRSLRRVLRHGGLVLLDLVGLVTDRLGDLIARRRRG